MYRKIFVFSVCALVCLGLIAVKKGFCYRVPPEDSNVKYLYVFGEGGKKSYGAKTAPQVLFLKVPASYTGDIKISIYDPDIGGYVDEKSGKWNTETRFSILGGAKAYSSIAGLSEAKITNFYEGTLLDAKEFGEDAGYDKKFYHFSPISADRGEKIGDFRYFKIVAEGLSGDDNNVFSLEVSPDTVETFAYTLSLRLSERRGEKMALYPDIPADTARVIEYNYDLDPTGGDIELISQLRAYKIKGSGTGVWANTTIDVSRSEAGKRWVYEITKGSQPNANMAMYLTTEDGSSVPVYFRPGPGGPKMVFVEKPKAVQKVEEKPWVDSTISCNTFTFDGSKSYDPDNQQLTYFWDFGDGATSSQIRIMHTYKEAGKYLVKLTITDASEAECNTATTQQVVRVNEPPCAIAKGPGITCVDSEIIFDGTQSSDSPEDRLTYKWDFGDGNSKEGAKVNYRYKKGGNYLVTLTVMDDSAGMCDIGTDRINVAVNTPPVADAGKGFILCQKGPGDPLEVTFDGSKSSDADNDNLTYIWDFGDGGTAEGKVITHRYQKGGEYITKLLVLDNTDTGCDKSTATRIVKLNRAPMADAGENINICVTEKANLDASLSLDNDGDTLAYTWDFGDGKTATGKSASHKYEKGGLYKVKLTVNDNTGTECASASEIILVDVNSTPAADILAKDLSCAGESVKFDGASSSDPDGDKLSFTWDFGDGSTGSGNTAKHTYAKGGLYKATLFVDDEKASNCSGATKVHYVNVNTPPVAEAGPDLIVCVDEPIEFDGTKSSDSDDDKLTYTWDFGDGQTAVGPKVTHAYKKIGQYKAVLTVSDDSGAECNASVDTLVATVNAEPVPIIEVI